MIRFFVAFILVAGSGCALPPVIRPKESTLLFPHGTYYATVKLQINKPTKVIDFKIVTESLPSKLKIMGISHLGSTDFRFEFDWKSGRWSKELYEDETQRYADEFIVFFGMMRDLFAFSQNEISYEKHRARFDLLDQDENHVPRRVQIKHPRENMILEITNYEFYN